MATLFRTGMRANRFRTTTTVWYLHTRSRFAQARTVEEFKQDAASISAVEPTIFKKGFRGLPATSKWFTPSSSGVEVATLNTEYLSKYGAMAVPLELTRFDATGERATTFERFEAPLSLLLTHMTSPDRSLALYLAQCPLGDLPSDLQADLPTPTLIKSLGRGDIYASSLWMGRPPTRTPLHRDPNPNLFVQLAGRKVIRLMKPEHGKRLYERSRTGRGHANLRGSEMMAGKEMEQLENAVWGDESDGNHYGSGIEAILDSGDALLIPLGWWHAVRGVGHGPNASVNWWFR